MPGDIVLVPFPFTDLTFTKVRPSLVIFNEVKIKNVIILPITSKKSGYKEYCLTNENLEDGELPIISYVRYNKVTTLDISLIKKKVAKVKEQDFKKIVDLFKGQF